MSALSRLLIASVTILLLAGCEDPFSDNSARNRGFIYCGPGQPNTFNPQLTDGGLTADALSSQLFDRLLQLDPNTYQPKPMLAQSWEVSPDGKEYTFNLRKSATFQVTDWFIPHRGLTAEDVVFSFERLIDPDHPFHKVSGGEYPWFDSMDFRGLVDNVAAIGQYQVRFTLSRPDVSFLSTLATTYAVVHSAEYAKHLLTSGTPGRIDTHPVGSGAFYLDEYQPHRYIRLKRHWGYWNGAAPMEQVVFDISTRGTGTFTKLITRECDVLSSPIASQLSVIEKNPDFVLASQTGMNVAFLALNTRHPALSELEVRQAISLAINRDALIQSVYYGTGTTATGMLPPMSWAYDSESTTAFDPQLALGLMAKAGYRHGFTVELLVPLTPKSYNPSPRKAAELIQSNLAAIGITVNIVAQEDINRKQLKQDPSNLDMVLTGWIADNGDPDNFLRPLLSCNAKFTGWNLSNWCNRYFDRHLDSAIATDVREDRREIYLQAQAILQDRMPLIPLAHGVHYQARNAKLQGITLSPFGDKSFANVSRSQ
ncbi:ABC transporter substrate-binding protein [Enterovibrio norvegicus FF-33]|uniref:ABC transporter substrate-binding protein n=1 Tax=Enterovibrio norvegicus FF-454 TaxID=1185651 RepID=A0A1E5C2E7_9GAMM|nr:ABC transporter substrate-binding protein SapA [Enterovibrio norvegicus]OEE59678.1 ABC transporter substrate-binding protein [Enterovibrio norvegicus FF-454]OEE70229.1 ABC transporter substrate-binding protein [Enterovibrio norvegicus FF-33]OEE87943.1 ABC transporter substrate-binding protein [Enterovibrio norvegicus FF-162]